MPKRGRVVTSVDQFNSPNDVNHIYTKLCIDRASKKSWLREVVLSGDLDYVSYLSVVLGKDHRCFRCVVRGCRSVPYIFVPYVYLFWQFSEHCQLQIERSCNRTSDHWISVLWTWLKWLLWDFVSLRGRWFLVISKVLENSWYIFGTKWLKQPLVGW